MKKKRRLFNRVLIVYLIITLIFSYLVINLINLQIVEGNENLFLSSSIKTSETIIRAPRGLIYDRSEEILVKNTPSFKVVIDLNQLNVSEEVKIISRLAEILGYDEDELFATFKEKAYEGDDRVGLSQITLVNNIDRDNVLSIYSRKQELTSVFIEISTTREYIYGENFAHILGYIREVSSDELDDDRYSVGDLIGDSGLENLYDDVLRGINGKQILETDRDESIVRELTPISATPGNNLHLTVDMKMQNKLTEVLADGIRKNEATGGAAIIMDVNNGAVLSLVSLPSYDPNKIIKGLSQSEYQAFSELGDQPFFNRAISLNQPPGSTFKTIVGSAALEEGVIDQKTVFESEGCMDLGGGFEFCEVGKTPLGTVDIYKGVARSSNIFFCNTMMKLGIDNLNKYTDDFGLGKKTGIDLPGEQAGMVASKKSKEKLQGEPWYLGDSCNTAIGQGLTRVSPLQMVSWVSTIANGGKYFKPHIVDNVQNQEGVKLEDFESKVLYELPISDTNLNIMKEGMHLVVNDPWGSAYPLRGLKSDPAAKTGSAEAFRKVGDVFEKQSHSWITGFFPYDDPKYAFVVYLEYGGWGFNSAEVMKSFLDWYDKEYSIQ